MPIRFPPVRLSFAIIAASLLAVRTWSADKPFVPVPAPAWKLPDLAGREVSSDEFKGKVLVLDFWATWCAPCRTEIPGYLDLQRKEGKSGLVIVGVSLDQEGPDVVQRFVASQKITYPVVLGDDRMVEAFGGLAAIPTTFIIDRNGTIRFRKVGAMPADKFEAVLKTFLE